MKHFFTLLLIWAMLILCCGLFYLAVTFPFPSAFLNIASFISACFFLIQACGLIDKEHGFGKHSNDNNAK